MDLASCPIPAACMGIRDCILKDQSSVGESTLRIKSAHTCLFIDCAKLLIKIVNKHLVLRFKELHCILCPTEHIPFHKVCLQPVASFSFFVELGMRLRCGSLRQWHWISSALGLAGLLFFAATGITLNHAEQLESRPEHSGRQVQLPEALHQHVQSLPPESELPQEVQQWIEQQVQHPLAKQAMEWQDGVLSAHLTHLLGEEDLQLHLESGILELESTQYGWITVLNHLHTNRYASALWSGFVDLFAISCLIFSFSGLLILKRHASGRLSTWPLIGLGLLTPVLLVLSIH